MVSIPRRKLLAIIAAAPLAAPLACRHALAETGDPARPPAGADDPLLQQAADWVAGMRAQGQTILPYPISRLQRRLRIGYNRTCALMDALERRGDWTIALDAAGSRYARIGAQVRA